MSFDDLPAYGYGFRKKKLYRFTQAKTMKNSIFFFLQIFTWMNIKKISVKDLSQFFFFFSVLSKSWFIDSHDIVNIQTDWFRVNAKTRRIFAFDHQTWISRLIFCFNLKKNFFELLILLLDATRKTFKAHKIRNSN